jgi:hypothetical protein
MKPGFALSEINTTTRHPARMYDAYLGGKDNYPAGGTAGHPAVAGDTRRQVWWSRIRVSRRVSS